MPPCTCVRKVDGKAAQMSKAVDVAANARDIQITTLVLLSSLSAAETRALFAMGSLLRPTALMGAMS